MLLFFVQNSCSRQLATLLASHAVVVVPRTEQLLEAAGHTNNKQTVKSAGSKSKMLSSISTLKVFSSMVEWPPGEVKHQGIKLGWLIICNMSGFIKNFTAWGFLGIVDDILIKSKKIPCNSTVRKYNEIYKGNSEKYKGKIKNQDISILGPKNNFVEYISGWLHS